MQNYNKMLNYETTLEPAKYFELLIRFIRELELQ